MIKFEQKDFGGYISLVASKVISIAISFTSSRKSLVLVFSLRRMLSLCCGIAKCNHIAGRKLAFVPILRAGLGMVDGCVSLVPAARIGHIGLYRDETTHTLVEYYCKLPKDIDQRDVYVVDPMLATGGSAIDAIGQIKLRNPRKIVFMCISGQQHKRLSGQYPSVICNNIQQEYELFHLYIIRY